MWVEVNLHVDERRIVPDTQDAGGERQYPKLGDVLPVVGKVPFYETAVQA